MRQWLLSKVTAPASGDRNSPTGKLCPPGGLHLKRGYLFRLAAIRPRLGSYPQWGDATSQPLRDVWRLRVFMHIWLCAILACSGRSLVVHQCDWCISVEGCHPLKSFGLMRPKVLSTRGPMCVTWQKKPTPWPSKRKAKALRPTPIMVW